MKRVASALLVCGVWGGAGAEAQTPGPGDVPPLELCDGARASLAAELEMSTVIEPDTLDDWRTRRVVPGCRVTAAGLTTRSSAETARRLFDVLRSAGWTRTPEPMDSPGEASLRFRKSGADCLFSYASGGLLDTAAALRVDSLVVPGAGERRYNVVARCIPAGPAARPPPHRLSGRLAPEPDRSPGRRDGGRPAG